MMTLVGMELTKTTQVNQPSRISKDETQDLPICRYA